MKTGLLFLILLIQTNILPQNNLKELDDLINTACKLDLFSGVILVADKENVQFLKTFGYADWDNQPQNMNVCKNIKLMEIEDNFNLVSNKKTSRT
jgi:hypothetical protein